jgi:hypothetical protein
MSLEYNQAGYCRATNEKELYKILLEQIYIKYDSVKEQFFFAPGCKIDFFAKEIFTKKPILIEVKNWFLTIKDMEQLIRYYIHAIEKYGENNFSLIAYIGGCEKSRQTILEKLGIETYITKDLVN